MIVSKVERMTFYLVIQFFPFLASFIEALSYHCSYSKVYFQIINELVFVIQTAVFIFIIFDEKPGWIEASYIV